MKPKFPSHGETGWVGDFITEPCPEPAGHLAQVLLLLLSTTEELPILARAPTLGQLLQPPFVEREPQPPFHTLDLAFVLGLYGVVAPLIMESPSPGCFLSLVLSLRFLCICSVSSP